MWSLYKCSAPGCGAAGGGGNTVKFLQYAGDGTNGNCVSTCTSSCMSASDCSWCW